MKDNAYQIVGKTIIGVIIKETKLKRSPHHQLFLIFDVHTSYDFIPTPPSSPPAGWTR